MKKSKKFIAVLLCSGLALSAVACESDPDTSVTEEKETTIEITAEETTEATTSIQEETSETTETIESSVEETTEATSENTEIVFETTIETSDTSDTEKTYYQYGPIFPIENQDVKVDKEVSMEEIKAVKSERNIDESTMPEGTTLFLYGYADIVVDYDGSDKLEKGAFLISNIRCVVYAEPVEDVSTGESGHEWHIDDDTLIDDAVEVLCTKYGIEEVDLGLLYNARVVNIHDKYWSSLKYDANWSKLNHAYVDDLYY